jgi:hypothetical protein
MLLSIVVILPEDTQQRMLLDTLRFVPITLGGRVREALRKVSPGRVEWPRALLWRETLPRGAS